MKKFLVVGEEKPINLYRFIKIINRMENRKAMECVELTPKDIELLKFDLKFCGDRDDLTLLKKLWRHVDV